MIPIDCYNVDIMTFGSSLSPSLKHFGHIGKVYSKINVSTNPAKHFLIFSVLENEQSVQRANCTFSSIPYIIIENVSSLVSGGIMVFTSITSLDTICVPLFSFSAEVACGAFLLATSPVLSRS